SPVDSAESGNPPAAQVYPAGRPTGYVNPILAENALPGDSGWRIVRGDGAPSNALAAAKRPVHVEAYADRVSAKVGDVVRVMANVPDGNGSIAWSLYRLGW